MCYLVLKNIELYTDVVPMTFNKDTDISRSGTCTVLKNIYIYRDVILITYNIIQVFNKIFTKPDVPPTSIVCPT